MNFYAMFHGKSYAILINNQSCYFYSVKFINGKNNLFLSSFTTYKLAGI